MNSFHHPVAAHQALAAALARLMALPFPLKPGAPFTVAAIVCDEGDGLIVQFAQSVAHRGQDVLVAVTERQKGGGDRSALLLIETVDDVIIIYPVFPSRIAAQQPVMLISSDHRRAWQLGHNGLLHAVTVPSDRKIARGAVAVQTELQHLITFAPGEAEQFGYVALPPSEASEVPRAN